MDILTVISLAYVAVACSMFLFCIIFGKILKKISLGNGVELGIFNSLVLSVFWPITFVVIISGFLYEVVQWWKKL